ncbi:MAG TPA: MurR/RpiR family transcriptional regulator [Usitatibacter sp.]|jgi:DNA-binding MurR/RpiR family transcriptional regulator|nr:MurR/RpiR family transcriptional regulator [Usitatibacter sp.]
MVRDKEGLVVLLRDAYPSLSPELAKAARFLADRPGEIAVSSMRALAARAGAKPPTLVRLAKSLGFAGWPALRAVFLAELGGAAYASRAQALQKRGGLDLAAGVFEAQRRDIDKTEAQSAQVLPRVAALLHKARTVHVAGFRASYAIAFGFAYLYRLFRSSVTLVAAEGGTLEAQLRAIGPRDALVVVSFAPYSREARLAVECAKRVRAKVVAITDSALAPIALEADETVLFSVTSPSFFPSIVGGVSVAESLLGLIVAREGKGVVRRIESAERQLFESGTYEMATPSKRRK